ncbi:putative membrane protein YcfT [Rhodococcus sp. LBL1]|nr:putative membrane protein YcfT [Rhodococcus sp. LBL1]MDH6684378.1 putative membrane protein YcfT [Rhodococcus sp. LBL2]
MNAERRFKVSDIPAAAWAYVRRAPGTFVWLAILLVTSIVMDHLSPAALNDVLGSRSTNLHHLQEDPVHVLITSALWLAGGSWLSYFVLFNLFHVPVERWLGTVRWLTVAVVAHVGATYISEGVLYLAINHDRAPESAVNTLDVGVSYALAGVTAVLAYRIAPPWRYLYAIGVLVVYGLPLFGGLTFTDIGHFTAVLIGFACYPITRARPGTWNPEEWASSIRARVIARR